MLQDFIFFFSSDNCFVVGCAVKSTTCVFCCCLCLHSLRCLMVPYFALRFQYQLYFLLKRQSLVKKMKVFRNSYCHKNAVEGKRSIKVCFGLFTYSWGKSPNYFFLCHTLIRDDFSCEHSYKCGALKYIGFKHRCKINFTLASRWRRSVCWMIYFTQAGK